MKGSIFSIASTRGTAHRNEIFFTDDTKTMRQAPGNRKVPETGESV